MPEFLYPLPLLFAMGLAGSLHCAGMCGGLVVLATGSRPPACAASLALYLTGKSVAYVFLGALAGALGEAVVRAAPLRAASRVLAVVAALVLVWAAMGSFGLIRPPALVKGGLARVAGLFGQLAHAGGASGKLVAGLANGFLPCPMTYAFLASAAAAGSAIGGSATMLVLALTSAAPLIVVALLGHRLAPLAGRRLPLVAGALMLVVACFMLYRGIAGGPAAGHGRHMH